MASPTCHGHLMPILTDLHPPEKAWQMDLCPLPCPQPCAQNFCRTLPRFPKAGPVSGVPWPLSLSLAQCCLSPPDELTCSARLTVRPSLAPLFTRLLEDVEVLEGRAARFDCKISGTPPPSVTWTHFGTHPPRYADIGRSQGPKAG